jgi:DNA-binding NarL/FixJ family response regulator
MTAETAAPIRVLLADDHAVVRKGIREFLEVDPHLSVIAEAEDGEQAVALALDLKPDVTVLDIQMPKRSGIETTRLLREAGLGCAILILSAYDDEPFVRKALQAGANGYILKTAKPQELIDAVHGVREGQCVLDHRLALSLASTSPESITSSAAMLSAREAEVLQLAAQGFTNKAIAAQLRISDRTVQGHLASIFDKLGAQSRTDAVMIALKAGLISMR